MRFDRVSMICQEVSSKFLNKFISIKYGQTILVSDIKSISLQSDGSGSSSGDLSGITELKMTDNLNEITVIRFSVNRPAQLSYIKDVIRAYCIRRISTKKFSIVRLAPYY